MGTEIYNALSINLAAISVVISLINLWVVYLYTNYTRDLLETTNTTLTESYRPVVSVQTKVCDRGEVKDIVILEISNSGNCTAKDIKIKFNKDLNELLHAKVKDIGNIEGSIMEFMPAHSQYEISINRIADLNQLGDSIKKQFRTVWVCISYSSTLGIRYKEKYEMPIRGIDYNSIRLP